jgi:SAM-dependent methyltransferase
VTPLPVPFWGSRSLARWLGANDRRVIERARRAGSIQSCATAHPVSGGQDPDGARGGNRTHDVRITSATLCRLRYTGGPGDCSSADPRQDSEMSLAFPPGFFDRADPQPDTFFYLPPRLVTHIDEGAIAAVGDLYAELGLAGTVLDLMSSWVSHFHVAPKELVVLGMNDAELDANPQAARRVVHDLNADPTLPFDADTFDAAVCCVSIDYLVRPVEVFAEVARIVRPGGPFVCTFSNRLFPTKAIRGWLYASDDERCAIAARYFELAGGWESATIERRTPALHRGDPLYAVWARRQA